MDSLKNAAGYVMTVAVILVGILVSGLLYWLPLVVAVLFVLYLLR